MDARLSGTPEAITERQIEVARLVAEGKTNPEIAAALGISLDGAKYHVSELLGRLGLARREEIAAWYRARSEARGRSRARAVLAGSLAWIAAGGAAAALAVGIVLLFAALAGGRSLPPGAMPAAGVTTEEPLVEPPDEALGIVSGGPARRSTGAAPSPPVSDWLWPVDGRVLREFTPEHPLGIDIEAPEGTPVRAAAGGTVVFAGGNPCCSYGLHVVIDHGGGRTTVYAQLEAIHVADGQQVDAGEVIGVSGATGYTDGPALHFEIRRDGVHQDPAAFLP